MTIPSLAYAVVGVGAVGGYYGARLAAAGATVHWLARSDADVLARDGLWMSSPTGDVHLLGLSVTRDAASVPPVDVVLVATKTTDTPSVLPAVTTIVGTSQRAGRAPAVVCLQNGYGVEDVVAAALPDGTPVLGGMCFLCSTKDGPGRVRHVDYGAITVAERSADGTPAGVTDRVAAVCADFDAAAVPAEELSDLLAGRWRKLVWNIPYNGLSVVLDAGTDEIMADPDARRLAADLMREVVAGSEACGHPVPRETVGVMLALTERMTPYDTSMRLDHRAGRPMEVEAIYRAPVAAASAAGCGMPRTQALADELAFLDRRRQRRRAG